MKVPKDVLEEIEKDLRKFNRTNIQRCTMCQKALTQIRRKDTKNTALTCTDRDCMLGINISKVSTWEVVK